MPSKKLTKNIINSRLFHRGIEIIGEYTTTHVKTNFRCSVGHIFEAQPNSVLGGKGCSVCSITKRTFTNLIINERLESRGIRVVGEYKNSKIKTNFECECGHIWSAMPNSIFSGKGCPKCAIRGYNSSKPGWIYVLDFGNYIKYGITNNLNKRLRILSRNGQFTTIFSKLYQDGNTAKRIEQNIKLSLGGNYVSKDMMPDGYTETLSLDDIHKLLDFINQYL